MITEAHSHTSACWWNPDRARWTCRTGPTPVGPNAAAAQTPAPDTPLVDVRDMLVVHTALLREFRLAPAAVRRSDSNDPARAAAVDRHLGFLCDLLHHHHEGEDTLLWPVMRGRIPQAGVELLDAVQAQHDAIDAALGTVNTARAAWLHNTNPTTRDTLTTSLEQLYPLLKAHLDLEECAVLPLAASVLNAEEWHAIGDAAAAAMPKPALMLAFGIFAYEGDPTVLAAMLSSAPAIPRLLIPRIAPRVYARRARQIHGTARP